MANMVFNHPNFQNYDLSSLVNLVMGGSPLSLNLFKQGRKLLPRVRLIQGYGKIGARTLVSQYFTEFSVKKKGCTECSPMLCVGYPEDLVDEKGDLIEEKLNSCGRLILGVTGKLVDDEYKEVGVGKEGELVVKGANLFKGYYKNEEATKESFVGEFYKTGDVGVVSEDGFIFLKDRKKQIIISGGENVYPREVEDTLGSHPAVLEVCVFGIPHEKWGEEVVAAIYLKPEYKEKAIPPDELTEFCRKRIAHFKCPKKIFFHSEPLPKAGSGKILSRVIREPFWVGMDKKIN